METGIRPAFDNWVLAPQLSLTRSPRGMVAAAFIPLLRHNDGTPLKMRPFYSAGASLMHMHPMKD
jgi:hypothetical protein